MTRREKYLSNKANGMCVACGCRPNVTGLVYCPKCRAHVQRHNHARDAHKAHYQCRQCSQLGHYSKTCQSTGVLRQKIQRPSCFVKQRCGRPCRSCNGRITMHYRTVESTGLTT